MIKSFIVVLFGALQCFPAIAEKLSFEGNFIQGGLVIGKTNPGTKITLDGRQVRVTEDGMFIFGFGRDAGMTAILRVVFPDGKRRVQPLTVTTRKIPDFPDKWITARNGYAVFNRIIKN